MENRLINNTFNAKRQKSLLPTEPVNLDSSERILSAIGGSYLVYKSAKNLTRHPLLALQGLAAAGLLIYRGATGVCPLYTKLGIDHTDPQAIHITEDITVNVPTEKVYAFWRDLSNLPKFMQHLKSVEELGENKSRWTAHTPGAPIELSWNAEITHEENGRYIGWQSVEGSDIENAGKITFTETLNGIGTAIHVEISYFPPAGSVGRGIASMLNGFFEQLIRKDIQGFKNYVEHADFLNYAGLDANLPA
ncbi:MAG: SRPBCC family protein [Flavobacteriales bacterium]|nr:MAG: SRPBCC family protein [Flavobacteriales bacterium]